MPEKISQETRSRMMAGIKGKDTKPELMVRSHLHRRGFRFRLHHSVLQGRPDVVLPRWGVAIFVHGCFWHGHSGCRYFRTPKTRTLFWEDKIKANVCRDRSAQEALAAAGWRVAVIWECSLRDDAEKALEQLTGFIRSESTLMEIGLARPPT